MEKYSFPAVTHILLLPSDNAAKISAECAKVNSKHRKYKASHNALPKFSALGVHRGAGGAGLRGGCVPVRVWETLSACRHLSQEQKTTEKMSSCWKHSPRRLPSPRAAGVPAPRLALCADGPGHASLKQHHGWSPGEAGGPQCSWAVGLPGDSGRGWALDYQVGTGPRAEHPVSSPQGWAAFRPVGWGFLGSGVFRGEGPQAEPQQAHSHTERPSPRQLR